MASQEIYTLITYLTHAHQKQMSPPEWVTTMPFVGKYLVNWWNQFVLSPNSLVDLLKNFDFPLSKAGVVVIDSFVIIGLLTGFIMGVLYYFLNIPIPVVLAVLTALVTVIPFALIILLVGISAVVAAQGMIWAGVTVLIVGVVLNLITDHWVRPVIIGRAVRMHFLATLFGALGGLEAFGFIGIFLGPVVISLALLIWDESISSSSK